MRITHHRQTAGRDEPPQWNLHNLTEYDMKLLASGSMGSDWTAMARDALEELQSERDRDRLTDAVFSRLPDDPGDWDPARLLVALRQAWDEAFPLNDHEALLQAGQEPASGVAAALDMHIDDLTGREVTA